MTFVVRRFTDLEPQPWRNGRGVTVEIVDEAASQALAPGSAWRLSVARLDAPGEFSVLPGLTRTLIPWGGDILLDIDGEHRRAGAGHPVLFAGDARVSLLRLSGPCHAINLMKRGSTPTLDTAAAGAVFASDTLALLGSATAESGAFDLVRVPSGDRLPVAGAVLAFTGALSG